MPISKQNVYLDQPIERIRSTIALLKHFKSFLRSQSRIMGDPIAGFGHYLDKDQAKAKLTWLVQTAINRKAGIPDVPNRKSTRDYQTRMMRDANRVRDKVNHRIIVRQFETDEIRKRFSHLITE